MVVLEQPQKCGAVQGSKVEPHSGFVQDGVQRMFGMLPALLGDIHGGAANKLVLGYDGRHEASFQVGQIRTSVVKITDSGG